MSSLSRLQCPYIACPYLPLHLLLLPRILVAQRFYTICPPITQNTLSTPSSSPASRDLHCFFILLITSGTLIHISDYCRSLHIVPTLTRDHADKQQRKSFPRPFLFTSNHLISITAIFIPPFSKRIIRCYKHRLPRPSQIPTSTTLHHGYS